MPKVSIILPTYNGERFIKDSVQSVINQSFLDWELIIVNDCSTDNTLNIIKQYANTDSRIKIISNKKNLKLPLSLNRGFSVAKGIYYTWTSDDNMYKPKALEKMVNYLDENKNCDLVSFNFEYITEDCRFIKLFRKPEAQRNVLKLARHCNIGACFMYRKEIANKAGDYDTNMFCAEDYDYWCRIALLGNIHYQNENLYQYRKNSQSLTATKQDIINPLSLKIRLKYADKIMTKLGLSKEEKIARILNFYYKENKDKRWLELAYKIHAGITRKYQIKHIIKTVSDTIFSVKNKKNDIKRKILTIFGVKIKFRIINIK